MALVLYDRVQQTGTANTTVSFTLSGSVTGYQSFSVVGNGNTTYYGATDANGNWEAGIGTYATGGTLTRTTILSSSNSGSAVTFVGTVTVFVTYPSSKSINYDANDVATIGTTLGYSDTGIIGSFASTVAGYNQVIIQNKSSATNASSNLNVSNDASTSTSGYAELGINSSTFSGTGSFGIAGASYLASASTDLTIGTYGAYNLHFVTNSNTTDAMTIYNSGGVSLGGYADPGIGTLYANNIYLGFNAITAAAGTTVLTNASSGYQNVTGTTTQTIQLPVATTLYKGLAFTVANASTGAVTIKDSASTTLDTIVTGGTAVLVLTNNGTSAGTWVAYSYLPSTYDFSTTTANFGNATITNALWNGTTIASGYGGTGLTTFTGANNALYSTSSSALAAGTLPVAAGGTGATTLTGYVKGSGTSALTAASTIPTTDLSGTITNAQLANSAITINGTSTSLGGSISVGTVTSVTGTSPVVSSGGTTPAISMPAATTSVSGYLTSTDWNTFNGKAPAVTYTTSYIPYGQGTTTPNQSSALTFATSTLTAPVVSASNGLVVNSSTVSASYSLPSGSNAMSVGPMTIASGQTVTVASGQRWVVL